MIICHVCGAEVEDGTVLCPVCGAQLDAAPQETAETGEAVMKNPTLAVTVNDFITADVFEDLLREENIPFYRNDGDISGAMHMGFGGGFIAVDFFVDEENLEKAQELYKAAENA